MPHRSVRLTVLLLGLAPLGCGDGRRPVQPVEGKVLYQGKPIPQAVVVLHPEGEADPQAPRPLGYVDAEGKFKLTSYAAGDGAPEGTYRVTVAWNLARRVSRNNDDTVTQNYLPARYANPQTSGLRVTVAKGQTQLEPITLTR